MRSIHLAAAASVLLSGVDAGPHASRTLQSRGSAYVPADTSRWLEPGWAKAAIEHPVPPHAKFTKRGCIDHSAEWDLTPENWKAKKVDEWLQAWWAAQPQKTNFIDQLFRAFSDVQQAKCDATTPCSAPNCANLRNQTDPRPYLAMNAVANLSGWMGQNFIAINTLAAAQSLKNAGFVNTYSSAGQKKPDDIMGKILVTVLTNVVAGGIGFIPAIGSAASGAVKGVAGILFADTDNAGSLKFDKFADLGDAVARMTDAARTRIQDDTLSLLNGDKDKGGNDIMAWLKNGAFVHWESGVQKKLDTWYSQMTASGLVNQLWKEDSTYIVRAPTTDCINDPRFTNDMKWCDMDDKTHVYYLYGYNRLVSNGLQYPQIGQPLGWQKLETDFKINRQMIIWSSVKAWKHSQYNYTPEIARQRFEEGLSATDETMRPSYWGAAWEGFWTLPICDSQDSRAVDSGSGNNMRYPCQCGKINGGGPARPLVNYPAPSYSDNDAFQKAAGFTPDSRFKDYCWNKQCCFSTMSPFCQICQ